MSDQNRSMPHDERSAVLARWRALCAAALAELNTVDPYGLEPGAPDGVPADEYGPEADAIAAVMLHEESVTVADLDTVWRKWFGESLTDKIGVHSTERLAVRLTALAR